MKSTRSPFLLGLFGLLCLLFFVLFSGLGIWQIERLAWKTDLIQRVNSRIHLPPVEAPVRSQWASVDVDNSAYLPVKVTGRYLYNKQIRVIAVADETTGYWVITPLVTNDGSIIMINRGFIPMALKNEQFRNEAAEATTVTGLLRISEGPGFFPRKNDPEHDIWYNRDVKAMAKKLELTNVAPYFIDAAANGGKQIYPIGGLTVVSFPNSHLTYIVTWFLMAGGVLAGSIYVFLIERKRRK